MRYLTLVLLIFYFTSCAKDDNKSDSSTSATVLEGTWVIACEVNSSDNSSYNITDVFSGNNVVTTWNYFSDNSCTASTKYTSTEINSTISIGDDKTLDDGTIATKFLATLGKYYLTPHTDDQATSYNTGSHCGKNNWIKDTKNQINGANCNGTVQFSEGTVVYVVFRIVDGKTFSSGSDLTDYPSSLDDTTYTKQ